MNKDITIYVKLTNQCNLCCDHCYNSVTEKVEPKTEYAKLPPGVIDYVSRHVEEGYNVQVAVHGGEPMLDPSLDEHLKLLRECGATVLVTSNLIKNVTVDLINSIKENCIQKDGLPLILTSWDYKIRFKKALTEQRWIENVMKLQNHGIRVQPIVTVTKPLIYNFPPEKLMEFLLKGLGCYSMNFERLTCTGRAETNKLSLQPDNAAVEEYLLEAYKLNKDVYKKDIPLFHGIDEALDGHFLGCRARKCTECVRTVSPHGYVATCPNMPLDYVDSTSLYTHSLDMLSWADRAKKLREQEEIREEGCYTCEYFQYCNGDCFQLSWDHTGCPGMKKIWKEALRRKNGL